MERDTWAEVYFCLNKLIEYRAVEIEISSSLTTISRFFYASLKNEEYFTKKTTFIQKILRANKEKFYSSKDPELFTYFEKKP